MKHALHLAVLLFCFPVIAQTALKGNITDTAGNPVPFASIYLPESKKSTVSNEDGNFYILVNPAVDKVLIVAHLSYENIKIKIDKSFPNKIVLKNAAVQLEEVVVGKRLSGYEIAVKVAENINTNHDIEPAYYEYFTRIASYGKDLGQLNYIEEYYGKLLHKPNHNTHFTIAKSRVVTYTTAGEDALENKRSIALWAIRDDNVLLYEPAFFSKGKLKKYTITFEGSTTLNDRDCYIIKYLDNNAKYITDKMAIAFVDKETYGVVKLISGSFDTKGTYYKERNFINVDNKWVLSFVTEKGPDKKTTTTLYNYLTESKDYEGEDFEAGQKIFNRALKRFNKNPDDTFWDNYQHIPLPE